MAANTHIAEETMTKRLRLALIVGLAGASFALLASCESGTAPSRSGAAQRLVADRESATDADGNATVVIGTGDPSIDVAAVQSAVDAGGAVVLQGHFSFDKQPTNPVEPVLTVQPAGLGYAPAAEVLISKAVSITGTGEGDAEMTTIDGGTIPFYVNAPGQRVTIRRLRFIQPTSSAILVYAASGLEITRSAIAGVVTYKNLSDGIGINTSGPPPTLALPGHPENISGTLIVAHNDIDMVGGTSSDNTLGVVVFGVGTPGAPVEAHVGGNRIRNTTEPSINFRQIEGRAEVSHNVIATGAVVAGAPRDQVIRVASSGLYHVTDNRIDCEWPNPEAEGIAVFSNIASKPIRHALVEHNDVTMSAPAGTSFTAFSAGIAVYGFADGNVVRENTIRGQARAGVSIPVFPLPPQAPAAPEDNAFLRNRFVQFTPDVADIFVGAHALRTRIVGRGTVDDEGDQTVVLRRDPHAGDARADVPR